MKASDQIGRLRSMIDLNNHKIFNILVDSLQNKIKADCGIDMQLIGRKLNGDQIQATLIAYVDQPDDSIEKVQKLVDDLKNPSTLTDLMK